MSENSARLTEGPIGPMIFRMALPMVFATAGMIIFNLTDTFFVGQLGKDQLAALTFTFPVVLFVNSLGHGVGSGASAAISRAIGEGNWEQVRRLTTDALVLALLICGTAVIIGLSTLELLFKALGASGQVLGYVKEYMQIWYPGSLLVMVPMVGNNAIRATGDTKTPSMVMMCAAILNMIFDPLLIFGYGPFPALGIRGAALTTVISRAVTLVAAFYVLAVREKMLTYSFTGIPALLRSWGEILWIGLPTAIARIVIPMGTGVITRMVAASGTAAVAAYGVGTRIEFFTVTPIMAIASVLGPFVGQNLGARRIDRIKTGINISCRFAFIWGVLAWLVFAAAAPFIVRLFNDDPAVIQTGTLYLRIALIGVAFQGILQLSVMSMNVLRKPLHASGLSIFQMFGIFIPAAYLLSSLFGLTGIFSASFVSYSITGIIALIIVRSLVNGLLHDREKSLNRDAGRQSEN